MDNLVKKLTYLSTKDYEIATKNWNIYQKIITGVKEKKFKLYSILINNTHYTEEKLIERLTENDDPVSRNLIWVTFDGCTRILVSEFNDKLFLRITVYDGNLLYGFPEKIRFEIEVTTPLYFLYEMENLIEDSFENCLRDEYEEFLEEQKLDWIKQRGFDIISLPLKYVENK